MEVEVHLVEVWVWVVLKGRKQRVIVVLKLRVTEREVSP